MPKLPELAARAVLTSSAPPGAVVKPSSSPGTYWTEVPAIVPLTETLPLVTRTVPLLVILPVWLTVLAAPGSKFRVLLIAAIGAETPATAVEAGDARTVMSPLDVAGAVGA